MNKIFIFTLLFISIFIDAQRIESIQLYNPHRNDSNPIMSINENLILSFDLLDQNYTRLNYKITRYNAQWKPSKAFESEYLKGYAKNTIRDYQQSFNTRQNYTHYKLEFPNRDLNFLMSGNYQIEILKNNRTLFSRRFIVYEEKANLGLSVNRFATNQYTNQKINVRAQSNFLDFSSGEYLSLFIYKNNDLNNSLTIQNPSFTQPHQLIYNQDQIRFSGGVEFHSFDTKDLNNAAMTTQEVIQDSIYQTILYPVSFNPDLPYIDRPDINGDFMHRVMIGRKDYNSANQADYTIVHFALDAPLLPIDSKICIYGAFNNFQCENEDFLTYDENSQLWITDKLLKQGYYNYSFALLKDKKMIPEEITGSYWETENEYTAILYFRPWGTRYDLAIGCGEGFSRESQR